jgi:hypothetical protein
MITLTFDEGNWEAWITTETGVIFQITSQPDKGDGYRWLCGGRCTRGSAACAEFSKHGLSLSVRTDLDSEI